jgi:hypothetical protein
MLRNILNIHSENYLQQSFKLHSFVNKAKSLGNNHIVILNTLKYLNENNIDSIDRKILLSAYSINELPFYSKIILTFWWGGLSHQYQAPKFYKTDNLEKIYKFSDQLETNLFRLTKLETIEFKDSLETIFNGFYLKDGSYKMEGISISYFTKIFQFFFQSSIELLKKNKNPLPIIADKWSMRSILALMISEKKDFTSIFNHPIINNKEEIVLDFKNKGINIFESYWRFITFFDRIVSELNKEENFENISSFRLEEILFGKARNMSNLNNPRRILTDIIFDYYK